MTLQYQMVQMLKRREGAKWHRRNARISTTVWGKRTSRNCASDRSFTMHANGICKDHILYWMGFKNRNGLANPGKKKKNSFIVNKKKIKLSLSECNCSSRISCKSEIQKL